MKKRIINVVCKTDEEVELKAVEVLFAEDREILRMGETPNLTLRDDFLSEN